MRTIYYIIALMLCSSLCYNTSFSQATSGSIRGKVTTSDHQPAVSVTVGLKGTSKATITNDGGTFTINKIGPGVHTIEISLIGHQAITRSVNVETGKMVNINIQLEASASELQEVVVSSAATKFAKKQSEFVARLPLSNLENPQVYTVVPKELFQEQVATDFRSALQTVPGLSNITQGVGSGGIGLSIRLRGFSGTNAGGAIRNGMATNWVSLSDPVNLEAIEVIKGPSATLFGGVLVSYGGLVNRVTKKPTNVAKGQISYNVGSFGLSRLTADINAPLNEDKSLMFRINAAYHTERSFQDYGRNNTEVIAPALTYKINDRLTLDLDFEMFHTRRSTTYIGSVTNNGAVKAKTFDELNLDFKQSFTSNDYRSESKIFNAYARATYKLSEQWTSQTNYSYANSDNNANYMFLALNTDSSLVRRVMNIPSTFGVNQFQQNFIGDFRIGRMRNRFLGGLDYTQITSSDRRTGQMLYDTVKFNRAAADLSNEKYQQMQAAATRTTFNRNYQTYSAYASNVLNITDALIAMASVRVDHYNTEFDKFEQTSWSPKLGLVYQIVKNKVSLFGNFMNGFTNIAPGYIYEVSTTQTTSFKPEHANQVEGGLKMELLNGKLNGTLSYYNIKVEDKVRNDPFHTNLGSVVTFQLQDGTHVSKGFEADLIANPFKGLHIIAGYGYNDSKFSNADSSVIGLRPTSAPEHVVNAWISYKVSSGKAAGFGIGVGGNYQSDSYFANNRLKQGAYFKQAPFTFGLDAYTRLDATVFFDQPKYRLDIKINSLTNKEYWTSDAWAYREPTRQLIFNLSYKF